VSNTVRVIIQVSDYLNSQLIEESDRLGIPKTSIVSFALDQYFIQKEGMRAMPNLVLSPDMARWFREVPAREGTETGEA